MFKLSCLAATIMLNFFMHASAGAQTLEVKRYNYAEWTKGRFTEVVTVTGPGKISSWPELARRTKTSPRVRSATSAIPTFNANTPTIK